MGVWTHPHGGIAFSFVTPQSTPDSAAPATQQSQRVDPVGWAATAADAAVGASLWRNSGDGFSTLSTGFCQNKTPKERHKNHFHTKKIILSNYIHNLTEKQKTVVITVITFIANFKIILQSRSMAQPEVFRYFKKTCMYTLENKHRTCKSWFQKEISSPRGHFQVSHFQVP